LNIEKYWKATLEQNEKEMKTFFHKDAVIRWHNTNEQFSVDEYILANCKYPGNWKGNIDRIEVVGDLIITVTKVLSSDEKISLHAISFIKIIDNKITSIDEYWSEDGEPPKWRDSMNIGKSISD
jgi:hypothetical protein